MGCNEVYRNSLGEMTLNDNAKYLRMKKNPVVLQSLKVTATGAESSDDARGGHARGNDAQVKDYREAGVAIDAQVKRICDPASFPDPESPPKSGDARISNKATCSFRVNISSFDPIWFDNTTTSSPSQLSSHI